jgi:hypothetical protein
MCAAAEAEDNNGLARGEAHWLRQRSNCCVAAEKKQLHDKAMEDGGRRRALL